jgi:hypothetical protein
MRRRVLAAAVFALASAVVSAQRSAAPAATASLHSPLDQILDVDVRDGLVYYRTLKSQRAKLDHYVASLNVPASDYQAWSREQQMAFWVNAYNAFVLETVINHYPLHATIRQIPGAFDKTPWHAAGRAVTLDQIENTILPPFKEPRLYLALGRGAISSGRLRSEAYTAAKLDAQLAAVRAEFVSNQQMIHIDEPGNQIVVTPIVSWHAQDFIAAYDKTEGLFAPRSPIERAVVAFIAPNLLPIEQDFVHKNTFKMAFGDFDWTLNDLTGR